MDSLGTMGLKIAVGLVILSIQIFVSASVTNTDDVTALNALKELWENTPPSWRHFGDPCDGPWDGIACRNSRVISITLSSMGLIGTLSGDIEGLSELQTLDLSYNKGLTGPIPPAIGSLKKLRNLIVVGCNFNGVIPDTIGSLRQLVFLSLNSNSFTGSIPSSIGNLSKLYWLDLAENQLTGTIPVSNGSSPGLDMLVHTKHFHLGRNRLSGSIPSKLFHQNLTLIHLLLDNNQLTGTIPETLCLVKALEVVRLDWNSLTGSVPSNISNLTSVTDFLVSNNQLTGPLPDLTGMDVLSYLDMSNNTFEASDAPQWFTALPSMTTLIMENTQLQGSVPVSLFNLSQLQTVVLKRNKLSGTLDLGTNPSSHLQLVDLQNNNISSYTVSPGNYEVILLQNPICSEMVTNRIPSYCSSPEKTNPSYSTPRLCAPFVCNSNEIASPTCKCAYPYSGTLVFRTLQFSDLGNITYYKSLEQKMMATFQTYDTPVDSVSLSNISLDASNYLQMTLEIFPSNQDRFNRTAITILGFLLSNQTFKPPSFYGPFYFVADPYSSFAEEYAAGNKLGLGVIVGIAVGVLAILLVAMLVPVILCRKKRPHKTVEPHSREGHASVESWMSAASGSTRSQLFSFNEIKRITNNFSEANAIGSGAYGKVYRGTLAKGQLVAVKRARSETLKGDHEFRTEIELLSRVHHKNLVSLLGFCFDKGELILIYEYVPNGTLKDSLSGKSGIQLDWMRRIKVALGAARGLAYLHELATPPIIHRDIKPTNILLDENLNAKVSDFGLSKALLDPGKGHITTQVKGTMGYLDPEYYMSQKLNEKSDVYSFGVLMLELITAKPPIDRGRYIVREVRKGISRSQELYGLHELLDPNIVNLGTANLKGFAKFVDLALRCVEESGVDRPAMGEVVKQLEDILEMAGLNPYSDSGSATSSATFNQRDSHHLYGDDSLYVHNTTEGALPR